MLPLRTTRTPLGLKILSLKSVLLVVGLWMLSLIPTQAINASSTMDIIQSIVDDITLPHESRPHGVPLSYGWALKPGLGMSNNPGTFRALAAWGQVYESIEGSRSKNTRVQIKNLRAYRLSAKYHKWYLLQQSYPVVGSAFREDFKDNINQSANLRNEADGSISVLLSKGFNFHFWPVSARVPIDPSDIGGIFIAAEARLILDQTNKKDDRSLARYLMSIGGDYWLKLNSPWDYFKTNGGIGVGRFRYIGNDWKTYTMTTASASTLRRFPPPLDEFK
jgi:hypothetical protein